MNRSKLPPTAFADPTGPPSPEIESWAEDALRRALQQLTTASRRSPLPEAEGLESVLGEPVLPERPVPEEALLGEVEGILAGAMNPAHPGFMGHMDPMPATASVLGDLLAAAANNNMLSREMSPTLTRVEKHVTSALARRFGLGSESGGVMTSGGTLANLQALAAARNAAFDDIGQNGVGSRDPVLFASEEAHTSLQKAAMLLGIGTSGVALVPTDGDRKMDPDALRGAIREAEAAGQDPFGVVATAGTTTAGAIDPLSPIADVAEEQGLWLHVDAAYGGALVFSDRHQTRLDGIERADSVTFNPQKWAYVAKTSAMVLFRDLEAMQSSMRVEAPYMRDDRGALNLGEISVQGTRHADALKLWLTLRHLGREGLAQLVDESYRLTRHFVKCVEEHPLVELATEPELNLICFRGRPDGAASGAADRWNADLQQYLVREAEVFLSLPRLDGRNWLRAVLLNPFTEPEHIDRLFKHLDRFAARTGSTS